MPLQNKKILFLAPKFFGYEIEIEKELTALGAEVLYFDERPKNDFITKACIRLNLKIIIYKRIELYFKSIIKSISNKEIDYLFLISPEAISVSDINLIKRNNPNIKVLIYFWDSIRNRKNSLEYLDLADKYYTFDSKDKQLSNKIEFLPLFYIQDYTYIGSKKDDFIYDACFIGTAHSDRYLAVRKIEKQLSDKNYKFYYYLYSPSKILFLFKKIFDKRMRTLPWKDISFKSLGKDDLIDIISKSKSIVDIHHPKQSGLTMRTIEMLGAKRKLFTTNNLVKGYDFYNSNNISVFDRDSSVLDLTILNSCYSEVSIDIYERYSLNKWLNEIFS